MHQKHSSNDTAEWEETEESEEAGWWYIDDAGAEQGPFLEANMWEWHRAGYFDATRLLMAPHGTEYRMLEETFRKVGLSKPNCLTAALPLRGDLLEGRRGLHARGGRH